MNSLDLRVDRDIKFNPSSVARDRFTGQDMRGFLGQYGNYSALIFEVSKEEVELYENLMTLCSADRDQFILPIYAVGEKNLQQKHCVACEEPFGNLRGYVLSNKRKLFIRRDDGTSDMSTELIEVIRRIAWTIQFLDGKMFHLTSLTLEQIYLCGTVDNFTVKLLPGVSERVNETKSAFSNMIGDLFRIGQVTPSPDVSFLRQKMVSSGPGGQIHWKEITRHPACLDYWQKLNLLLDAKRVGNHFYDKTGCLWPNEPPEYYEGKPSFVRPSFRRLASKAYQIDGETGPWRAWVTYEVDKFSGFVTLVRNKVSHYRNKGALTRELTNRCGDSVKFIRYVEQECPKIWLVITDATKQSFCMNWGVYDDNGRLLL